MVIKVSEGGLRMKVSSTEQGRGSKVWFAVQGNVSEDFIGKDKHHRSIGQREAIKYLRESYYHRIECSIANSLTALMRK